MSLSGLWLNLQDLICTALHLLMKIPMANFQATLFQSLHISRWRCDALQPPQVHKMLRVGIHMATSLMAVSDVLLGTQGVSLDRFFSKKQGAQTQLFREAHGEQHVYRKYTGRMNFSRLFSCGPRDSGCLVRSFLAMGMQGDRLYASIRTFCLMVLLLHM